MENPRFIRAFIHSVLGCDQFRSGPGSRSIVVMPAVANQLGAAAGLLSNWFAVTVSLHTRERGTVLILDMQ